MFQGKEFHFFPLVVKVNKNVPSDLQRKPTTYSIRSTCLTTAARFTDTSLHNTQLPRIHRQKNRQLSSTCRAIHTSPNYSAGWCPSRDCLTRTDSVRLPCSCQTQKPEFLRIRFSAHYAPATNFKQWISKSLSLCTCLASQAIKGDMDTRFQEQYGMNAIT